ncbi:hypothetical protein RE068_000001, partial [Klebsiella pneumoniae]|nr:hypothetical protein [Klebsiella pneumoniae]
KLHLTQLGVQLLGCSPASIAQHHGHNYGLAMALVAGTVAIVITVLTFFGREGRVIQSAGAGHHQPLSTSR